MTVDRVRAGDALSAAQQNTLADALNGLLHDGRRPWPLAQLALFELAQPLTYSSDLSQCPSTDGALAVWYLPGSQDYGGTNLSRPQTVYCPRAHRDAYGFYLGIPLMRAGDQVWCWWNQQSAHWEIVEPPQTVYRGIVNTVVYPGGTTSVNVWTLDSSGTNVDSGVIVWVWDFLLSPSSDPLPLGTVVKIEWFNDDGNWYITAASCNP